MGLLPGPDTPSVRRAHGQGWAASLPFGGDARIQLLGIDMIDERIPDETTILNFRHLPVEHQIADQILEIVNQCLSEKGVMLKEGTILDATSSMRPAPPRTRRASGILKCIRWPRATSGSTAAQKASPTDCAAEMRIAMKPGQRRVLPDTAEGRLFLFGSSTVSLDSGMSTTEASTRTTSSSRCSLRCPISGACERVVLV